ncbi:MAG TPA: hypothetical protein ENJ18_03965, partial [Nannocystis exedens]|nr:hypothetical protein [Nannocystis exedens]
MPIVRGWRMSLAAIVLAAGASSRMGRAKALIKWHDQSFLRRVIGLAEASSCTPIVVVQGAIALPARELGPALRVVHTGWSNGQLSSLQAGLTAILDRTDDSNDTDHTSDTNHISSINHTNRTSGQGPDTHYPTTHDSAEATSNSRYADSITGVMVLTIDRPRILPSTCQALAAAHRREPWAIWQPAA